MSIFQRTLLLMFAALLLAVGIGATLLVTRPPVRNMPISVADLARLLRAARPAAPEDGGPAAGEWRVSIRDAAPGPVTGEDAAQSSDMQRRLALLLGGDPARVRLSIPRESTPPPRGQLGEGVLAGWQLPDGRWRVAESIPRGILSPFARHVLLLALLGAVLLVPVAWLFARALAAPIRAFAAAATRLGSDPDAPALERGGPVEMQAAVDAFNTMQQRLNRLLAERTEMIGAIAHDLRTPLARLAFRLESLPQPLAGKVEADISEMNAMIVAALDFLRDRSVRGERQRLDFRLLVESIVDDRGDVGQDVTLQRGAPVTVLGDPVALRRAVGNIVDNAVKYGERARLALHAIDGHCELEIDDDGPGISPELHGRVFEPFFRAETSRNRETGGIGLGLATVRAIALDHGGDVRIANRDPGGLRVTFTLPVSA